MPPLSPEANNAIRKALTAAKNLFESTGGVFAYEISSAVTLAQTTTQDRTEDGKIHAQGVRVQGCQFALAEIMRGAEAGTIAAEDIDRCEALANQLAEASTLAGFPPP